MTVGVPPLKAQLDPHTTSQSLLLTQTRSMGFQEVLTLARRVPGVVHWAKNVAQLVWPPAELGS